MNEHGSWDEHVRDVRARIEDQIKAGVAKQTIWKALNASRGQIGESMTTMKSARARFAARTTISAAVYEGDKLVTPRKRARHPVMAIDADGKRTVSFREWARRELRGALSPKLARIVRGVS